MMTAGVPLWKLIHFALQGVPHHPGSVRAGGAPVPANRINAVLAYLMVGILLSADVLGQLARIFTPLEALVIHHRESIAQMGELGVVFLLFLIGLELSFERLNTMRRLVFGLGGLQFS